MKHGSQIGREGQKVEGEGAWRALIPLENSSVVNWHFLRRENCNISLIQVPRSRFYMLSNCSTFTRHRSVLLTTSFYFYLFLFAAVYAAKSQF